MKKLFNLVKSAVVLFIMKKAYNKAIKKGGKK